MSENDLVRRGDVEAAIREMDCANDCYRECCARVAVEAIRAVPADRMAEASAKLAEATHKWYWTPSSGFGSDEKRAAWTLVTSAAENYRTLRMAKEQEPRR